jgi:hypothetical protein
VEAFSATLRNQVDLTTLSEQLIAVVQETMQPTFVSLWLRPSVPVARLASRAGELCADMLSFIAARFEHASTDDERIELMLRYAPAMLELEKTIARTARRQRRQRRRNSTIEGSNANV